MLRPEQTTIKIIQHVLDLCVFAAAFAGGWWIRLHWSVDPETQSIGSYWTLFVIFYFVNQSALSYFSSYQTPRMRSFTDQSWIYFKSVYASLVLIMAIAYTFKPILSSRMILLSASSMAFLILLAKEGLVRRVLQSIRVKGRNLKRVLLVAASEKQVVEFCREIEDNPLLGLRIEGVISTVPTNRGQLGTLPVFGDTSMTVDIIEKTVVDTVAFLEPIGSSWIKDLIWECEQRGIEVWVKLEVAAGQISRVAVQHLGAAPFLTMRSGPRDIGAIMIKYAIDRLAALTLLLLLSPLMLLTALLVKLTSPGPVFFKQHRATVNGRRFVCLKFRSMVSNAEALKESLQSKNEMKGVAFKMKNDPRITPIGRFLRKSSIDELPQLINVLLGDMSLVGPRPMCVLEAARIQGWARRRLSMKPGITCIWQVTKRSQTKDFDEWAQLDLQYIDNWSLWLDLSLLLKTIPAVLKGTGV